MHKVSPDVRIEAQVGSGLFAALYSAVKQMNTSVLDLMEDPVRIRQIQMDRDALQKLERAFAELKRI